MCTPGRPVYQTVTVKTDPLGSGAAGVITSLFAGHGVPFCALRVANEVECSSGLQAGGSGLCRGPPTCRFSEAWCAAGRGSFCPRGSPGNVGCTNRKLAGAPLTWTRRTVRSGPIATCGPWTGAPGRG